MNPRGQVFSNAGTPVSMHVSSSIGTSPYQAAGRLATTLSFIINNRSTQKVRQTETKAKRTVNKTEKTLCRSHTGPVNSDQSLELSKRCLQTAEKSRTGRRGPSPFRRWKLLKTVSFNRMRAQVGRRSSSMKPAD